MNTLSTDSTTGGERPKMATATSARPARWPTARRNRKSSAPASANPATISTT